MVYLTFVLVRMKLSTDMEVYISVRVIQGVAYSRGMYWFIYVLYVCEIVYEITLRV